MKKLLITSVAAASLSITCAGFAATAQDSTAQLNRQIRNINKETRALQSEVAYLKREMRHSRKSSPRRYSGKGSRDYVNSFGHGVTVTTSPFLGLRSAYDASDLLSYAHNINEDLTLLQQRQALDNALTAKGISTGRPIVELSGYVEGQIYHISDNFRTVEDDTGIGLSDAELDTNAAVGPWATAFLALKYDGTPVSLGNRSPNSDVYLQRGFATIGNLSKSPFYFTLGKMYLPFGAYHTGMVSEPLTTSFGRVLTNVALAGFAHGDWDGSIYGYSGDMITNGEPIIRQEGVNLNYNTKVRGGQLALGGGAISNIADSQGMQDNGLNLGLSTGANTTFGGFGRGALTTAGLDAGTNNQLAHRVPAYNLNAMYTLGHFTLIGEWIDSLRSFAATDLTFNNHRARPGALHAEVSYLTNVMHKPTSFGLGYGQTWQALALNLPRESYSFFVNTSIWKDTVESIEFRHDKDYGSAEVANGGNATTQIQGTGQSRNAVVGQLAVYF